MQNLLEKWKAFVHWMSAKGIPVPLLRNPKHQEPSLTFTMVIASYCMCLVSAAQVVESLNFDHYFELFMAVAALYFGRNFQKNNSSSSVKEEKTQNKT